MKRDQRPTTRDYLGALICVWYAVAALSVVSSIGDPAEPVTPERAVHVLILVAALIAATAWLAWGKR